MLSPCFLEFSVNARAFFHRTESDLFPFLFFEIADKGSIPELRILSILLIYPILKWCM